jgi:hypothetical protein
MNEQLFNRKWPEQAINRNFKRGITLANNEIVKKFITYREITVVIGILVALVIVLTLWVRKPGQSVSGYERNPHVGMPVSAKDIFKSAVAIFKF